jgi:hypothetical protein
MSTSEIYMFSEPVGRPAQRIWVCRGVIGHCTELDVAARTSRCDSCMKSDLTETLDQCIERMKRLDS